MHQMCPFPGDFIIYVNYPPFALNKLLPFFFTFYLLNFGLKEKRWFLEMPTECNSQHKTKNEMHFHLSNLQRSFFLHVEGGNISAKWVWNGGEEKIIKILITCLLCYLAFLWSSRFVFLFLTTINRFDGEKWLLNSFSMPF